MIYLQVVAEYVRKFIHTICTSQDFVTFIIDLPEVSHKKKGLPFHDRTGKIYEGGNDTG